MPPINTLGAGDRVRIIVFGQQNLSNVYTASATGTVSVPLIGQVRARGLTAAEVVTHRPFDILGRVTRPGQ